MVPKSTYDKDEKDQKLVASAGAVYAPASKDQSLEDFRGMSTFYPLRFIPDKRSFKVLPWNKKQGLCMVKMVKKDGEDYEGCPRNALTRVLDDLKSQGYEIKIGFEIEFTILNKEGLTLPETNSYASLNSLMSFNEDLENIYDMLQESGIEVELMHCESAGS